MFGAGFIEVRLDYWARKSLAIGASIESEDFAAGGYLWRVRCYPRGDAKEDEGEYVSIFLTLVSESCPRVKAIFDAFVLNGDDGTPSSIETKRFAHVYRPGLPRGWSRFVRRRDLELDPLVRSSTGGAVRFMCGVIVVSENPTAAVVSVPPQRPPDGMAIHLGRLLDRGIGADVTFVVGGESFPAHRAVLAMRSPVFEAQLLGSMADATTPSITVQDIEPAAFEAMLRFVYTDSFPDDGELGDPPTDMLQHLLAAADRYALDRLKTICALKLIENVSVDTVGSILVCAETYNCPKLKNRCLDFFAVEKNFKKAVFTDGFVILVQKFPLLAEELRTRVVK